MSGQHKVSNVVTNEYASDHELITTLKKMIENDKTGENTTWLFYNRSNTFMINVNELRYWASQVSSLANIEMLLFRHFLHAGPLPDTVVIVVK